MFVSLYTNCIFFYNFLFSRNYHNIIIFKCGIYFVYNKCVGIVSGTNPIIHHIHSLRVSAYIPYTIYCVRPMVVENRNVPTNKRQIEQ